MTDWSATAPPPPRHRPRWLNPLLAPMLRERKLMIAFGAIGVVQISVAVLHLPTIVCPILHVADIPCPGCGVTRACVALLKGDWRTAARFHVMAPVFISAMLLFATAAVLPAGPRDRMIDIIDRIERRTGLAKLMIVALFVYWIVRLASSPQAFIHLMRD